CQNRTAGNILTPTIGVGGLDRGHVREAVPRVTLQRTIRHMAGRSIRTFTVMPHLPERLLALHQLAYNMWWCWNHECVSLYRRIDPDLFEACENSPVKLLGAVDQA